MKYDIDTRESNDSNSKELITKEYILSRVSEYDLYKKYIGDFKIGGIYNSPLRKDKNPSFGIFYSKKLNMLLFKDHGSGETGDVIRFIKLLTGITNYNELLNKIVSDFNITSKTKLTKRTYNPTNTVIGVVRQPLTDIDKEYWGKYSITQKTLKRYNVDSIKYYLCNGIVKAIYRPDNPMYSYKVFNSFKIYRPFGDKYTKWRNNLTKYDIQGYEQLPEKDVILVITKSLKDVMTLSEMGISAIAPSSESTFIPDSALKALSLRFKTLLINFDRDAPGMTQMRKIGLKTGLRALVVPKRFKSKDISDAVVNTSFKEVKQWLKKELKQYD